MKRTRFGIKTLDGRKHVRRLGLAGQDAQEKCLEFTLLTRLIHNDFIFGKWSVRAIDSRWTFPNQSSNGAHRYLDMLSCRQLLHLQEGPQLRIMLCSVL